MSDKLTVVCHNPPPYDLTACYCTHAASLNGFRLFRCNVCWNSLVADKNLLVKELQQLEARLAAKEG